MKIALHSASAPAAAWEELLLLAGRHGCTALEIRSGVGQQHGVELTADATELERLRQLAGQARIALHCLSISSSFSDYREVEEHVAEAARYIRLAEQLGFAEIRLFCGRISPGSSRKQARNSIVEAIRYLVPIATSHGVGLLLETHDDWSDPQEMSSLLSLTDKEEVGVVWDVLHTYHDGGAGPKQVLSALGPRIRHVHVHDGVRYSAGSTLRHPDYRPIGSGDIDHEEVVQALHSIGYTGYLSGEWYEWEPAELHLTRELGRLQQIMIRNGAGH